jgi:PhzF family phenazine biosynthesis protein
MTSLTPRVPAVLVEAFTDRPCGGNGAAVVLLDRPLSAEPMQAIARSLNQSETAFLWAHSSGHWLLRWFTPTCEVDLCGHATLAATLALGHWQQLQPEQPLALHSRSGPLAVCLGCADAAAPAQASIVLPSSGLEPAEASPELLAYLDQQLGARPQAFWHSPLGYHVVLLAADAPLATSQWPVESLPLAEQAGLVLMQPLPADEAGSSPQVLGETCDYQLRFLAPGLGIPEDPVTGSAHALVAPWWLEQLGRTTTLGWQCSHRPGGMRCEAVSSGMIRLTGAGHLLWDGTLQLGGSACWPSDQDAWSSLLG